MRLQEVAKEGGHSRRGEGGEAPGEAREVRFPTGEAGQVRLQERLSRDGVQVRMEGGDR